MILENGCVKLRAIEERDFDILYNMMQSPEIEKAMGHCTVPISPEQQKDWMSKYRNTDTQIRLMIELENGKTIGVIMLYDIDRNNGTAELGHKIMAVLEDRIKGDMECAINAMLTYAFDYLRLNCIYCRTVEGNPFADKLLKKVGFVFEGTMRQRIYQGGKYLDMHSLSLIKEDYKNNN